MFYVIGLMFALRGGEEHRSLRHGAKSSQCGAITAEVRALIFTGLGEKLTEVFSKPRKSVDAYDNQVNPERCPVAIYRTYTSHCPKPLDSYCLTKEDIVDLNNILMLNNNVIMI